MEKFGAGSRAEGVQALAESVLEFVRTQLLSSLERAGKLGLHHRTTAPTATARTTTIAMAAKPRITFRQFGSLGG
ncbi:MAG TPA: hypothetical protein VGL16_03755 [Actinomycetota bacterium]